MLSLRARMMPLCQTALLSILIVVLCPQTLLADEISLIKKGGVYEIPVEINGVITLHFVLDTGAADVNIPADVALTLHRAGTIRNADFLPGKTYTLADGSTVSSSRFLLRSLKIGNRRVANVAASIGPVSSALLLGQSFLEKLGAWGIDSQRQVLTLGIQGQRSESTPRQQRGLQSGIGTSPPQPQAPPAAIVGNDGAEMVLVPAGEFIMGSDADEIDRLPRDWPNVKRESFEGEIPRHRVYLDAFYIDKYEVTNARFQQFIQVTEYRTQAEREGWGNVYTGKKWERVNGATWRTPLGPGSSMAGLEQHPVVQVSQEDAKAYCAWAGKRLPTEAEWEKAARGTDGRIYPWGNQFDGRRVNFCDVNCEAMWEDQTVNDGYRYTAPVGSYERGKSPYGAYDMAGNVVEWVADWFGKDYYLHSPARNPQGPASGDQAVVRGGGWISDASVVRVPFRFPYTSATRGTSLGFRCAKTFVEPARGAAAPPQPTQLTPAPQTDSPRGVIQAYYADVNRHDVDAARGKWKTPPPRLQDMVQLIEWFRIEDIQLTDVDATTAHVAVVVTGKRRDQSPERWGGTIALEKRVGVWKIITMPLTKQ